MPETLSHMLKTYITEKLLVESVLPKIYLLSKIKKDQRWKGGKYEFGFQAARASSYSYGTYAKAKDVSYYQYDKIIVPKYREIWGTLKFRESDIIQHGKVTNEQSFLYDLADQIDDFTEGMRPIISMNLLAGKYLGRGTSDGIEETEDGNEFGEIQLDCVDRLEIGQKLNFESTTVTKPIVGYVYQIDVNAEKVRFSSKRKPDTLDYNEFVSKAPVDDPKKPKNKQKNFSHLKKSEQIKCYIDGAKKNAFSNLRDLLLSPNNRDGYKGPDNIYNQPKLKYPYTQAINIDLGKVNFETLLRELFLAFFRVKKLGKGNPTEILLSTQHFAAIMLWLEHVKGPYKATGETVSMYNYLKVEIVGPQGKISIIGVPDMPVDIVYFMDYDALKLASNKFIQRRENPDTGAIYYPIRSEEEGDEGFIYLVDICFYGELCLYRPSSMGIGFGIPDYEIPDYENREIIVSPSIAEAIATTIRNSQPAPAATGTGG